MKLGPFWKKDTQWGYGGIWGAYLGRLFPHEHGDYLGKVGGKYHLCLHLFSGTVEDGFPERNEELVGMLDASFHD